MRRKAEGRGEESEGGSGLRETAAVQRACSLKGYKAEDGKPFLLKGQTVNILGIPDHMDSIRANQPRLCIAKTALVNVNI